MKSLIVVVLLISLFSQINHAALMENFYFTGIVKAVKDEKLTVFCQGQKFQIAKTDVLSGIISPGEPIYFQIKADQMQNTFFKRKPSNK